MYFVHASDRCTRKLSPLSTSLTSEHMLLSRSPLSRTPLSSLSCPSAPKPAYSTCRWDLTGDSSNVPGILLKKQLCVACSFKCKAYFIPYEPNSLQSLDALVVRCRWKIELQRLEFVCFGIWLWSRYSLWCGVEGVLTWLKTEARTYKLIVVMPKLWTSLISSFEFLDNQSK